MAARFAYVCPKTCEYVRAGTEAEAAVSKKITGLTMTQVRAGIVSMAGKSLSIAATIGVRYSTVRRQGFNEAGDGEHQVMDYTMQRHRLLPLVAASYCFHFTSVNMMAMMVAMTERVTSGQPVPPDALAELHATSSGLKAVCTSITADGRENIRRACGGHGYLLSSGLPTLLGSYLQSVTVEGDNYLLPQETVKFLLKAVRAFRTALGKGRVPAEAKAGTFGYLCEQMEAGGGGACRATSLEDMMRPEVLLEAFAHRGLRLVLGVESLLAERVGRGDSFHAAWNQALVEIRRAAHAHVHHALLHTFIEGVRDVEPTVSPSTAAVLQNLCRLHALVTCEDQLADFLEDGYMSTAQANWVREGVRELLVTLAPDAVPLVDAFDWHDRQLKSAIGKYDGQVLHFPPPPPPPHHHHHTTSLPLLPFHDHAATLRRAPRRRTRPIWFEPPHLNTTRPRAHTPRATPRRCTRRSWTARSATPSTLRWPRATTGRPCARSAARSSEGPTCGERGRWKGCLPAWRLRTNNKPNKPNKLAPARCRCEIAPRV